MTAATATPAYLSPVQIASELAWSRDTVLRAIHRGDLPAVAYGRTFRVARADLDAFIARHTTTGPTPRRARRRGA